MATAAERLQIVRDAIDAILTGGAIQSHSINGRDVTKCSLSELMQLERKLERDVNAGKGLQRNLARFQAG